MFTARRKTERRDRGGEKRRRREIETARREQRREIEEIETQPEE